MRSKRQQPPLKVAIQLFVSAAILIVVAFVIPLTSVSCSYNSGVQLCIETTYYGLDAHAFGIVLGILSVLCLAGGVFYLRRHKQTLAARGSGTVFSASQPNASQQPGAYPPAQNTVYPGRYTGDAPSQPPSNTFPRL